MVRQCPMFTSKCNFLIKSTHRQGLRHTIYHFTNIFHMLKANVGDCRRSKIKKKKQQQQQQKQKYR